MVRTIRFAVAFVLSAFAVVTWAQAQNSPPHQHTTPDLIDGAIHPELIPDSVAYRLYFVAVSENPTPRPNESSRQHSQLQRAGLSEEDIQSATIILASFKMQYAAMIDSYNHSPEVQSNSSDGLSLFLAKRDALVQTAIDTLRRTLSPQGVANLDARIKKEKAKMKVAAKEAQQ